MNVCQPESMVRLARAIVVLTALTTSNLAFGQTLTPQCRRVLGQIRTATVQIEDDLGRMRAVKAQEAAAGMPPNMPARCRVLRHAIPLAARLRRLAEERASYCQVSESPGVEQKSEAADAKMIELNQTYCPG
jgi:hypothetical protein